MYNLLYFNDSCLQIRVFSLFRKWKAFSVWRQNVKSKKIQHCKKGLNENLFIVNAVSVFVVKNCYYFNLSFSISYESFINATLVPKQQKMYLFTIITKTEVHLI